MNYKDYYKTLGLERSATQDEIKRSYRKLARKYHPDVSKEANAEDHFKEVSEAYEVLRDPEKRAAYDQFGSAWKTGEEFRPPPNWNQDFEFHSGGFSGASDSDFSEFFQNIFGQSGFGQAQGAHGFHTRGEDVYSKIFIDLEDSFRGASHRITLKQTERDQDGRPVINDRTFDVKIPKGICQGQHIRLNKQGGEGYGDGGSGDLYLEVAFNPHRFYSVEGKDIYLKLPVAPWEAALGATVEAPTPAGPVNLKINKNAKSGDKLRLKGRGIPAKTPGDLYAVLDIALPESNSAEARKAYEAFANALKFNPREAMGGN